MARPECAPCITSFHRGRRRIAPGYRPLLRRLAGPRHLRCVLQVGDPADDDGQSKEVRKHALRGMLRLMMRHCTQCSDGSHPGPKGTRGLSHGQTSPVRRPPKGDCAAGATGTL